MVPRHYRELVKTRARDDKSRCNYLIHTRTCCSRLYSEELGRLLRYLDFTEVGYSQLRGLATSLLKHKLRLSEAGCPLGRGTIASDSTNKMHKEAFLFCDPLIGNTLLTLGTQSLLLSCNQPLKEILFLLPQRLLSSVR